MITELLMRRKPTLEDPTLGNFATGILFVNVMNKLIDGEPGRKCETVRVDSAGQ